MPVIIRASVDRSIGWAELRFSYEAATIAFLKEFPGVRWDAAARCWRAPLDVLDVLAQSLHIEVVSETPYVGAPLHKDLADRLRPYQVEGAQYLLSRPGAILAYQMRMGKTPTCIVAACAHLGAGNASRVVTLYPNNVAHGWEKEWNTWANLPMLRLEGYDPPSTAIFEWFWRQKFGVIGCHYEILSKQYDTILKLLGGELFILIADEAHAVKKRANKEDTSRSSMLQRLCSNEQVIARWLPTGTPMRNRPKDLFQLFEYVNPGSMSPYSKYRTRYCNAQIQDFGYHYEKVNGAYVQMPGHWDDNGKSNEEELAQRLRAVAIQKTRAEVAPWLPKSDRSVVFCDVTKAQLAKYERLEQHAAYSINRAMDGGSSDDRKMLQTLVEIVSEGKIPTAIKRILAHTDRGVKVLVFAHFHATLKKLAVAMNKQWGEMRDSGKTPPPYFMAGGWDTDDKRKLRMAEWQGVQGPAILLANTLSSGIGIDLSDAEVVIRLELEWVPADLLQSDDRIQDVHLGKRKTPPLYECLVIKDTIDERMATAILNKVSAIEAIVGANNETRELKATLGEAGVADSSKLGLANTDAETVRDVLLAMQERWGRKSEDVEAFDRADVANTFKTDWEDEAEAESEV